MLDEQRTHDPPQPIVRERHPSRDSIADFTAGRHRVGIVAERHSPRDDGNGPTPCKQRAPLTTDESGRRSIADHWPSSSAPNGRNGIGVVPEPM
jgi:hypothetical protein